MDSNNIAVPRSPQNKPDSVLNSSEDDIEIVVCEPPAVNEEPLSYNAIFQRDRRIVNKQPDFQNSIRRSFLNECIHFIYWHHNLEDQLTYPLSLCQYNREQMWNMVDKSLMPEPMSPFEQNLHRVKRQLFREPKRTRKQANPRRGKQWGTQLLNYRPLRRKIVRRRLRRDYFKKAYSFAISALIRENITRRYTSLSGVRSTWTPGFHKVLPCVVEGNGIYDASANSFTVILNYHNNKAKHHRYIERQVPTHLAIARYNEGCHLMSRVKRLEALFVHEDARKPSKTNQNDEEEASRSMYFAKELYRLVQDHEEFVKLDKRILTYVRAVMCAPPGF